MTPGPDGAFWFTGLGTDRIGRIAPDGTMTQYQLPGDARYPTGIASGPDGNLWIVSGDARNSVKELITRVAPADLTAVPWPALSLVAGTVPSVGGSAEVGVTLSATDAQFSNAGSVSAQWLRCPAGLISDPSVECTPIAAATARSYQATAADIGHTLVFQDTAFNPAGQTVVADSAATAPVIAASSSSWFTEWDVPAANSASIGDQLAAAPDGSMWFTETGLAGTAQIGRLAPDGTIAQFSLPFEALLQFAEDPGVALYVSVLGFWGTNEIAAATPGGLVDHGSALQALMPPGASFLTFGSDDDLWGISRNGQSSTFYRVSPTGSVIDQYAVDYPGGTPAFMPDGSFWYDTLQGRLVEVTAAGDVHAFAIPTGGTPWFAPTASDLTYGSDGHVWFLDNQTGAVDTVDPSTGDITRYAIPNFQPGQGGSLVAGPDGALWFVGVGRQLIQRLTTDGMLTQYSLPGNASDPGAIAATPDGRLWIASSDARETDQRELITRFDPTGLTLVGRPTQLTDSAQQTSTTATSTATATSTTTTSTTTTSTTVTSTTVTATGVPAIVPSASVSTSTSTTTTASGSTQWTAIEISVLQRGLRSAIAGATTTAMWRHGRLLSRPFHAPAAGTFTIGWTASWRSAGALRHASVAFGSLTFPKPSTGRALVRLSGAGRRVLASHRVLQVVVTSRFAVAGRSMSLSRTLPDLSVP